MGALRRVVVLILGDMIPAVKVKWSVPVGFVKRAVLPDGVGRLSQDQCDGAADQVNDLHRHRLLIRLMEPTRAATAFAFEFGIDSGLTHIVVPSSRRGKRTQTHSADHGT